ncbi:hypothetical protein K8R04_01035 [Candidatus Uhrbacteria bacterium]|nr:hypothetical protein [Candidatus Uhrbacteria bacterium]
MNEFESKPNGSSEDLAHKVLDRIEEERVVPRPKWQFTVKDRLFWVFWILSIVLGSLLTAAIVFACVNAGWEFRDVTHHNLFGFLLQVLPMLWIVALLGALLLAYEIFRHTSRGYRFPFSVIVGLLLLITVVGGVVFYVSGAGRVVEEEIGARIPTYRPVMMRQKEMWSKPEQGLLAGEVLEFDRAQSLLRLRGFDGSLYLMNTEELADDSNRVLVERESVRVVGVFAKPSDGPEKPYFRPCYVFPWDVRVKTKNLLAVKCDPERIIEEPRSTECKGLIPYEILKTLRRGSCR